MVKGVPRFIRVRLLQHDFTGSPEPILCSEAIEVQPACQDGEWYRGSIGMRFQLTGEDFPPLQVKELQRSGAGALFPADVQLSGGRVGI